MRCNHSSQATCIAYGFVAFPLAAAFIAQQVIVTTHYAEITALRLSVLGGSQPGGAALGFDQRSSYRIPIG
jgi:hypothetical protein